MYTIKSIIEIVCKYYRITPEDIKEKSRKMEIVIPRNMVVFICYKLGFPMQKIALEFRRDIKTFYAAVRTMNRDLTVDKKLLDQLRELVYIIDPEFIRVKEFPLKEDLTLISNLIYKFESLKQDSINKIGESSDPYNIAFLQGSVSILTKVLEYLGRKMVIYEEKKNALWVSL